MEITTQTDIVPNSSWVALGAQGTYATWIGLCASSGSTTCRFGDSNAGAARGMRLPANVLVFIPRCDFEQGRYPLSQVGVYASGSDSISVTIGV